MKKTKKSKVKPQQQPARDLAEEALVVAIKNAALDRSTIKALRLTCKRTKVAADAEVRKFTLRLDEWQNSEVVRRSGLLKHITKLGISFGLRPSDNETPSSFQNLSYAVGLLNLAVDVCSNSLNDLTVSIDASPVIVQECASILGSSTWERLHKLSMGFSYPMSGFISSILGARPSCLPALKSLRCQCPNADDIEALAGSACVSSLTDLTIEWSSSSYGSNTAPAMVAAMRNLMQNATNLEGLFLKSSTFDFFECERLISLTSFDIEAVVHSTAQEGTADYAPVLARPWQKLEYLRFEYASLSAPNVVRIFEAQDTLPVLRFLSLDSCSFAVDGLSRVCRPYLKKFCVYECDNGRILISKMAQLMKEDTNAAPSLREFYMNCQYEESIAFALEALSKFLACPSLAALETLSINEADLGAEKFGFLFIIANHCPKLKHLDLHLNNMGRPAVSLLLGYGITGAWPELEKLNILEQRHIDDTEDEDQIDINSLKGEHPYMPPLEVETAFRRIWPGLECSFLFHSLGD